MSLDFNATMNTIILGSFMILILYMMGHKKSNMGRIPYPLLLFYITLIILRLCWPFDRKHAFVINLYHIYPIISDFLVTEIHLSSLHFRYYHVCLVIWGIGSAVYLFRILQKHIAFFKMLQVMPKKERNDIKEIFRDTISAKLYKNLTIVQTSYTSSPAVVGIKKPMILLPEMEFNHKELDYIIRHELQHIKNHDLFFNFLIELLCVAYWWNPLIYLLKRQVRDTGEVRVDSILAKNWKAEERLQYIDCLKKVCHNQAKFNSNQKLIAFVGRAEPGILERVTYLLEPSSRKFPIVSSSLLLMTMFFSITCMFTAYRIPPKIEKTTFTIPKDDSYIVKNNHGNYDLYINDKRMGTLENPYSSDLKDISLYNTLKEAQANEKK